MNCPIDSTKDHRQIKATAAIFAAATDRPHLQVFQSERYYAARCRGCGSNVILPVDVAARATDDELARYAPEAAA